MITARSLKSGVLIHKENENGWKRSKLPSGSVTLFSPLSRSALPTAPVDKLGALGRLAGLPGIGPIGDLGGIQLIERKVADQPRHDRLVLRPIRATLKRPARRSRASRSSSASADLIRASIAASRSILFGSRSNSGRRRNSVGEVRVQA